LVKNKWKEKEIKCYVVKYLNYSGISSPLTLKLNPNFNYALDTLIHELIHILISYDPKKYRKIEYKLRKKFPKETKRTLLHIYVIFIEISIAKKIFSPQVFNKIIKRIKSFKGIAKAVKLVLLNENNLKSYLKQV
jgi:hypothetical protein